MNELSGAYSFAELLALLIPLAVLVTLVAVLVVRVRARRRRSGGSHEPLTAYTATAEPDSAQPDVSRRADGVPLVGREFGGAPRSERKLKALIANAEKEDRNSELAPLYYELSQRLKRTDSGNAWLGPLRSAAGYGALHGPADVHATARMALAERALDDNDLTTACEHWQMARSAFESSGRSDAQKHVEALMSDNGCPTDWVLTDF